MMLAKNRELYLLEKIKDLPLNQLQWEVFLDTVKLLNKMESASIRYIRNRLNIGAKVTDRVFASLFSIGWAHVSKGRIYLSSQGKKDFIDLST